MERVLAREGFRVWASGSRAYGFRALGFKVSRLWGFRVLDLEFRALGLSLKDSGISGCANSGLRVERFLSKEGCQTLDPKP